VTFSPASGSPGTVGSSASFTTGINSVTQAFSGTGARNVLLTWGASTTSGVTYNVYRCSGTCASYPTGFTQIATGISVLTYTDADSALASGQTYVYAVTAVDTGGESTPAISAGVSFNF
jgi:fibronectin type 3 domain-containing protein